MKNGKATKPKASAKSKEVGKPVNTKSSRKNKENTALELYLETDLTQREICEIVDWSEKTFSLHKSEGNWEALKGAREVTSQKIIINLLQTISELSEDKTGKNSDAIIKLSKAVKNLEKEVSISNTIQAFRGYTTYLFSINPELAKENNIHQNNYIKTLVK